METPKVSEVLFAALLRASEGRAKLTLEAVQTVFLSAFPHWQGSADRRDRLGALLDELASFKQIRLPADRRSGWEHAARPPLPKWVLLAREMGEIKEPFDHRSFPWVAELTFVAGLRSLGKPDEVLRIHNFLKNGGAQRPIVPVKERSYELFGDEKRLDNMRTSQLFGSGRLNLQTLRCCDVPASLPCVPAPEHAEKPWLIVENEATFHSFCRLNRVISRHDGIILGSGLAVLRAVDFLTRLFHASSAASQSKEFLYFGDLDEEGIRIPQQLDHRLDRKAGIRVRPAEQYYEWLLDQHGIETAVPVIQAPATDFTWFPTHLRSRIGIALQRPRAVVQEAVGWELLARKFEISDEVTF